MKLILKKIVIRTFYIFFNPLRRLYWRLIKAKTRGVMCLIENDGRFLFVRNSYGKGQWTLPGGRVKKRESFEEGVIREVREEVGIKIEKPILLGQYVNHKEGKTDTVSCFYCETASSNCKLDPIEIAEAKWLFLNEVPDFQSHAVAKIIEMYKKYAGN